MSLTQNAFHILSCSQFEPSRPKLLGIRVRLYRLEGIGVGLVSQELLQVGYSGTESRCYLPSRSNSIPHHPFEPNDFIFLHDGIVKPYPLSCIYALKPLLYGASLKDYGQSLCNISLLTMEHFEVVLLVSPSFKDSF